jgi:serine/threonine-protein kinase RsbT
MTFKKWSKSIRTDTDVIIALSKLRENVLGLGFSEYEVIRVVTGTSELLSNILKYAVDGKISCSTLVEGGKQGVKIIVSDKGPGIANVEEALLDHYSSSGTLGLGLPGVKRMVDDFELNTKVGVGTIVTLNVWQL